MLFSSKRNLEQLAWVNKHSNTSISGLKQQKYLLFYEMFSKVNGLEYNIDYLKAYPNGPVFSNVFGDAKHRENEFYNEIESIDSFENIDESIANLSLALVKSFTDNEISLLTHNLDMWQSKEERIKNGERQIPISETDITESDVEFFNQTYSEYKYLLSIGIMHFRISEKIFRISEEDYDNLSDVHHEVIDLLSLDKSLDNPVYLELDENGVLLID